MSEPAHNYFVTTNPQAMDLAATLDELRKTYFGKERTPEQMAECVRGSMCFAVVRRDYVDSGFPSHRDRQVAFARVVSDMAIFSWVSDFVVWEAERGKGIGHRLLFEILNHHALKQTTFNLGTRDAGAFYAKFGFTEASHLMRRPLP